MRTRTLTRLAIQAVTIAAMAYLASFRAHAASLCVDATIPKGMIEARGGRWVDLTASQ